VLLILEEVQRALQVGLVDAAAHGVVDVGPPRAEAPVRVDLAAVPLAVDQVLDLGPTQFGGGCWLTLRVSRDVNGLDTHHLTPPKCQPTRVM